MGPRNAYKYMLDNVVSPITCVSMNHQNQLEQMANGAMFATEYRYHFSPRTLQYTVIISHEYLHVVTVQGEGKGEIMVTTPGRLDQFCIS
jgi:hypothetical protein